MNYTETIDYLFNVAPLFQHIGQGAYKEGLENTLLLDAHFGHPHLSYPTIHVGGTNGKGSTSHTLAAILQSAGYRVGLYTSPHLVDFRERIRVNGKMIPEQRVVDFVEQERSFFEPLHPSFFELTTALAFLYFKEQEVDVAVIEVGLGGRLDCTNIINPLLSVITNISFDHTQFLGHTLEEIATEKAGIIKQGIPVVIGETNGNEAVRLVFSDKAQAMEAPITFAEETHEVLYYKEGRCHSCHFGTFETELQGLCQERNTATILAALHELQKSFSISLSAVHSGFRNVCSLTGLTGRWQTLQTHPLVICDTGHNVGGLTYIARHLETLMQAKRQAHSSSTLRMVIGMVSDKDVRTALSLLPRNAVYYFTQASVRRALPAGEIALIAEGESLQGQVHSTVPSAYHAALADSQPDDLIFIGGSSFVVADLLAHLSGNNR